MKPMLVVGMLFLITAVMLGCSPESERMANMAERMVRSQNRVNSTMASANEKFVDLNKELQQERTELQNERLALNGQFENLEHDRRELHLQRRSELAWSESFQFLAVVLAAITPLFLCAYLIWVAGQKSVDQEEVNTILLRELASSKPRLIQSPNLPAIEHQPTAKNGPTESEAKKSKQEKYPFHTSSKLTPK